ncbi:MAG: XRE family transcriptional regulator [Oscillospiraceae bacterium]|nr:XRE family transcriptional regulator [Oscillospiraceae bacterium]
MKDTSKIVEELGLCADFKSFYDENRNYMVKSSLSELLNELAAKSPLKKSQIIKNSELSEVYAYQIFSGLRVPERKKLLSLCVGMSLNLDEVQSLLKCAGYSPLYVKIPFDSIIIYGICKKLSVIEINRILFEYDLETLG